MSLSSLVLHLRDIGACVIRQTTLKELETLQEPHPSTGLPLYRVLRVYLSQEDKVSEAPLFMIFVDNGMIYYCEEDVLSDYTLEDREFYTSEGDYDYEAIFEGLFLNGGQDIASFAGFFFLS